MLFDASNLGPAKAEMKTFSNHSRFTTNNWGHPNELELNLSNQLNFHHWRDRLS